MGRVSFTFIIKVQKFKSQFPPSEVIDPNRPVATGLHGPARACSEAPDYRPSPQQRIIILNTLHAPMAWPTRG